MKSVVKIDHLGRALPENLESEKIRVIRSFLPADSKVLEIGGRYGVLSEAIHHILSDRTHHVVVEPDRAAWAALEHNRDVARCSYEIVRGTLSSAGVSQTGGCGPLGMTKRFRIASNPDRSVPVFTYSMLKENVGFRWNTLVVDCEGAFVEIFRDFPDIIYDATLIFIDWDALDDRKNKRFKFFVMSHGFDEIHADKFWVYRRKCE